MDAVAALFSNLESNSPHEAEEARTRFHEFFNSTKEPWLLNGLFEYYIQNGSLRIVDIIVGVREPHEKYFFDRMSDSIRSSHHKLQALTLFGHVVCRHPSWLYKIMQHNLIKDLLRLLKAEKDVSTLMSALLIMIILLPTIAGLIGPHLQDLFEVFSHLASWNTNNPNKVPENQLLHLQVGLYTLFNRLYGMYPYNFINYLRSQYITPENHPVFTHTIKPMLDTVRIHPLLVTASRESEVSPARWKKMEANDVIMECAKYSVDMSPERSRDECFRSRAASFRTRPIDFSTTFFEKSFAEGDDRQVGGFSYNLPGHEIWSPTVYTGATTPPEAHSITHTPIAHAYVVSSMDAYTFQEGNSPPETAIEATPESTPVKDLRQPIARPTHVLIAQSQPSSPLRKDQYSPFKYPPNSSTPIPGHDSGSSAFHQQPPSKGAKDSSKLFANKLQRLHQDRVINRTEDELVKVKTTGSAGGGYYPPGSPLRLITCSPSFSSHTPDRTEEDKEVETMMQTNQSSSSLKRSASVKPDDELDDNDCQLEDATPGCSDGGLHFPDRKLMAQFARRVKNLRAHSQCQSDTPSIQLADIGPSSGSSPRDGCGFPDQNNFRRAVSCPEMKKYATGTIGSATLDETEEENEDEPKSGDELIRAHEPAVSERGTQTEDPPAYAYEHMFLSVFPAWEQIQQHSAPPDINPVPTFPQTTFSPRVALENHIANLLRNLDEKRTKPEPHEIKALKDHVELLTHQLQFERHRREVHAERNRRLLGKSRANRALEEHNSALRDQITLTYKDIEILHAEIERKSVEAKVKYDNLQKTVNYWKEQHDVLEKRLNECETEKSDMKEELDELRKQVDALAKKNALAQSKIFDMDNTVQDTRLAASSSSELKAEIAKLQHHVLSAGELEKRLRSTLDTLNLSCHKDMESLIDNMSYSHTLSEVKAELKQRTSVSLNLKAKAIEMEKAVKREELAHAETKKLVDRVHEHYQAKLADAAKEADDMKAQIGQLEIELLASQAETKHLTKEKVTTRESSECGLDCSILYPLSTAAGSARLQNLQVLVESEEASGNQ
ncbi:Tuberous sclerosis [Nesidiocoris tenuis]|uniref:Tuberous sclerosis n=1 Tax=Nesidiocoris tenuis TaxID=355587 RepID=A0ABN7B511_9HEMI|nr:Tuberous sclerosis [Nesidiocoris tenuis]